MTMWQELGDGVFRRRYESLDLNVGAVIGTGGVLLVDTRASHRQARELLRELRQITDLPVRRVVNTHFHWDHCWGNALFPDAEIWGHRRCREVLIESGEAVRSAMIERSSDSHAEEFAEVKIVPPEHLLTVSRSLDIGDRLVDLRHDGRGHTDSDITVTVPDCGVTFAGDLVEQGAPPSFGDSFPLDWAATLDRVLVDAGATIVPGHGDVVDHGFVVNQRDQIAAVADLAREAHGAGQSMSDVSIVGAPYPEQFVRMALERAALQLV